MIGSADYGAQVKVYSSGSTQLWIERNGTALVGGVIPELVTAAGTKLTVRLQVQGTSPTVIRAKVWATAGPEPASWQYTLSDSTAGLQSAGAIRLSTYLSSAATTGPVTVRWTTCRPPRSGSPHRCGAPSFLDRLGAARVAEH